MMEVPGLKIAGPLGKGGTAQVAKAFSEELKKDVALKFPLSDDKASTSQFEKLAQRESLLIGQLKFPGFVNVLKHAQTPPYLLLELCRGQSLEKLGKIDDKQMIMVVISAVAASLEFIRLQNIVHCDLKPQNVFLPQDFALRENGDLFFAKISDFSLGRKLDEPESARAGHGTVGYAAPETLKEGKTSHRSDLFSLGVIAYQLASGTHPFIMDETDPVKIESRIQEDEPVPLFQSRTDLPEKFIALVKALLTKDEKSRPESAWAVCRILKECGCLYPFEKVITASTLIKSYATFENIVKGLLDLSDQRKSELLELTDSRPDYLRLILCANFRRKNLFYTGQKFQLKSNFYWPAVIRRKVLRHFSNSPLTRRKDMILAAFKGMPHESQNFPPGTSLLIPHLLSTAFVKKQSSKYAAQCESSGFMNAATEFYLQAGNLKNALTCAEKATANLADAKARRQGIHLINRVMAYAELISQEFDTRQLVMVKADFLRAEGNVESAMDLYHSLIRLYEGKAPDKLLAETFRDLGDIYKTKQKFDDGIKALTKALDIYREVKDELEMSRALNNIGELYRIATDLKNSLKYMRQALSIQRRLWAWAAAANSLNNIAIIYGTKGQLQRAITILGISLKMKRNLGDQGEIARSLNNLGYANLLVGKPADAQPFLLESLTINRNLGSQKEILFNLWNLSEVSFRLGNLRDGLKYLEEGLSLSETLGDKPHLGRYHLSFGNILRYLGHFSESGQHLDKASALANEIDDEVLKMNLDINKAQLRIQIGDLKTANALAESALANSEKLKTQPEMIEALNILIKVTGQEKYLKQARELTSYKNHKKERPAVEFNYIQYLIGSDFISDAEKIIGVYAPQLSAFPQNIDATERMNLIAEFYAKKKNYQEAKALVENSYSSAHTLGLLPEEMNAAILSGCVAYGVGNYEEAYARYKTALQICRQIVNYIDDESDKKLFMNKPNVKLLVLEINRLGEKLTLKKKAGV